MPNQSVVSTDAPMAIGTYSQAVRAGNTVYLSGQIGLDPVSMQLGASFTEQAVQVFENLHCVAQAAGASLNAVVKLNVYLTDLTNFAELNEIMARYFVAPYPARAAVGVASLPRGALIEADAVLVTD